MTPSYKLYMLLLGCRPPGRHVEQHDFFFGIAASLKDLIPGIKAFWPQAAHKIHIDAWREVTVVEQYAIKVVANEANGPVMQQADKLFFINLGGYQPGKFEEQHYTLLTVKPNTALALKDAKQTLFFKENGFEGAITHVDDKYGIDVDDLYQIEDMLSPAQKQQFSIMITPLINPAPNDEVHLGYLKLSAL